jgi:hypothetical protein
MNAISSLRTRLPSLALAAALAIVAALAARPAAAQTPGATINWDNNATAFRGQNGRQFSFICPAAPAGALTSNIWGTGVYTDDSRICVAAVHDGRITTAGGRVTIEVRPGQGSYAPSLRNGVSSSRWDAYSGSYVFVGAAPVPPPPPPSGERLLGGLNLRDYCAAWGAGYYLGGNGVWYCVYTDLFGFTVYFDPDLTDVCRWQYQDARAYTRNTRPGDPTGWGCFLRT